MDKPRQRTVTSTQKPKIPMVTRNIKNIEGVRYDIDLLARLKAIWFENPPPTSWEWIIWRAKLLTGNLNKTQNENTTLLHRPTKSKAV